MTGIVIPQLLSPRQASSRTRLPWAALRAELERQGYRVLRVAGRERVAADDLAALLAAARQPTAAEAAAKVDVAMDLVAEEMGARRRQAPGRRRVGRP